MKEQISLREGSTTKKISKAEAILRGLAIGAIKGDTRSVMALFKLAEHTGEFEDANDNKTEVVVRWLSEGPAPDQPGGRQIPGISQVSRE
jgi:hypothetical protein